MLERPDLHKDLQFQARYSGAEFDRIRQGFIPRYMEDKWRIVYYEPWLYFTRSWTGLCIYGLRFDAIDRNCITVVESWVNCDPSEYKAIGRDFAYSPEREGLVVKWLIDTFLFSKSEPFPRIPGV
jgi:hypothetical protein